MARKTLSRWLTLPSLLLGIAFLVSVTLGASRVGKEPESGLLCPSGQEGIIHGDGDSELKAVSADEAAIRTEFLELLGLTSEESHLLTFDQDIGGLSGVVRAGDDLARANEAGGRIDYLVVKEGVPIGRLHVAQRESWEGGTFYVSEVTTC